MIRKYSVPVSVIASCGLLWFGGCQNGAKSEPEPAALPTANEETDSNGVGPRITFSYMGHDFGEVSPNTLYKADLNFTNAGDDTLRITKIDKCYGVVAKLVGGKKEYAPGESGTVQIEWRSATEPMTFTRELVVHTNDKSNLASKLKIRAKIMLKVTWEPKRLRLTLDDDTASSQKIRIRCLDDRPFSITSFKSTGDSIIADFDPSAEATEFVLEPKINT